jgi:hypothetical protein
MNADFVILGECISRPRGWRRIVLDVVCRLTGHLLWRSMNSTCLNPTGSLPYYGTHCKRCWKWGYVEGDYRQ